MYFLIDNKIVHIDNNEIMFVVETNQTPESSSINYVCSVMIVKRDCTIVQGSVNQYSKITNQKLFLPIDIWNKIKEYLIQR
jgi:hypothetical protein